MFRDKEEALRELEEKLLQEEEYPESTDAPMEQPCEQVYEPDPYTAPELPCDGEAYPPQYEEPEDRSAANLIAFLVVLLTVAMLAAGAILLYMGGFL